ncbi:MAG: CZB domain-containing protein [Bacteroidota bacterium]|jgi:hypothetical protein
MSTDHLAHLVSQLDFLILQHVNYLNKLDDCIKQKAQFDHKKASECNFGKLFYSEVWPSLDAFPEEIKLVIKDIEAEHQLFHSTAREVNTLDPEQGKVDATTACKLILKLYHLDELVKKHA